MGVYTEKANYIQSQLFWPEVTYCRNSLKFWNKILKKKSKGVVTFWRHCNYVYELDDSWGIVICAVICFQFCAILLELEESRGNCLTKAEDASVSGVIDTTQLSLHSVEELHKENQCLIQRLRDIEEEKDRCQSQETLAR